MKYLATYFLAVVVLLSLWFFGGDIIQKIFTGLGQIYEFAVYAAIIAVAAIITVYQISTKSQK
jgi:hypothetical protein